MSPVHSEVFGQVCRVFAGEPNAWIAIPSFDLQKDWNVRCLAQKTSSIGRFHANGPVCNESLPYPGEGFSLGGIGFTSSISDPVHGSGIIQFGNRVAPRFTLGWEDLLHHVFGRVTFPAEFGIQYSGAPKARLALAGTACADGGCLSVDSNGIILATLLEIVRLQNNFSPLTVYPIASLGVRYTFGH